MVALVAKTPRYVLRPSAALFLLLLSLPLILAGIYSLSNISRATRSLEHTDEVRVAIAHLQSTLIDAETGTRGYLVAGERAFLEPYQRALSEWRPRLHHVQTLTTDNPEQQQRLGRVHTLINQRLEFLSKLLVAFDSGQRGAALTPIMMDGKRTMDTARAIINEMENEEARLDVVRQRAAIRHWQWTMALLLGGALALVLVLGAVWLQRRDAAAHRHAEAAIHSERRLLKAVLAGLDDGITLQDRTGRLIFANACAARLIGFGSPEDLLAAPLADIMQRFEVFGEDGVPFPSHKLPARAILEGRPSDGAAVTLRYRIRSTAEERWSSVRANPIVDATGQIAYALNVFRDVTVEHRENEHKKFLLRAVDELNSSLDYEQTLSAVARLAVPTLADWCAVDIVDGGRTKRVATAHVDPAKLALVAELERRYPSDPNSPTGVPQIIRSGKPQLLSEIPRELIVAAAVDEEHLRLIDALELGAYLGVPLIAGGNTIGAIVFAMAESRRRYTEQDVVFAQALADRAALAIQNAQLFREVERARAATTAELVDETQRRQQAEDASRFAEMFVGILGHDLRNPLNAVTMTARLLQKKGNGDSRAIDRIMSSAHRMANMVDQLLDLTRSRLGGGITLERREIDIGAAISEIVDEMRLAHPDREIHWEARGNERALVDVDRLAQVVYNLVGNAVQHGDPGRPVTVTLSNRESALLLVVHNQGQPIPDGLLPVIFDPFRRTMAHGKPSTGLGLGLFITRQIVLAHGGSLDVRSTVQEGTTFTVSLPRSADGKLASPDGQLIA